jgi:tetratricopeptide (TPR) repeat protein
MRFTPFIILAAASVATAQTPPTPRSPARHSVSPAPRPQARPPQLAPGRLTPAPLESWELFDQHFGRLGEMSPMVPPLDLQLPHTTFEHQWPELTNLQDFQLDLQHDLQSLAMPMPSVHPFPDMQSLQGVQSPVTPWAFTPGEDLWTSWNDAAATRGALSRMRPDQGTPEDSLYKAAREALNRGEYSRASTMFRTLEQKYPRSRVAPAVLYWQAFALYRAGSTDELRRALEVLKAQQERYPDAAADGEAATLRTRLQAALAARGDANAAAALRLATAGGPTCDKEDVEVRAEALNALAQINPPEARPTLKKVLARRDECSVRLRRSAVYILGRIGTDESVADLIETAKTDPDPSVRNDAILLIGRSTGTATVKTLEQLFAESTDDRTKQAVLSALRSRGGPEARRVLKTIIERNDIPEKMRTEAISQLAGGSADARRALLEATTAQGGADARRTAVTERGGDDEDASYLRGLYAKTESPSVKAAIISSVARIGGDRQRPVGAGPSRGTGTRTCASAGRRCPGFAPRHSPWTISRSCSIPSRSGSSGVRCCSSSPAGRSPPRRTS